MNNDEMIRKRVHDAVDQSLSHLDARPSLFGAIMAKTEGERPMKRKVSAGLVFALALLLAMTAIGVAATRFGMLEFKRRQKENEEYVAHILTLDETYENEYVSITVTDAVFDGVQLSIAMEMQPKPGCGDGVYVYPEMSATVNGQPLSVDIEGCRGDFYSGIWSPEKDQGMIPFAGTYGADYVLRKDTEERDFVYEPQTDEVEWTLSLDILRPLYKVEQLEFGLTEELEYEAYMKLFADAYDRETILLPFEGTPVEYVYAVGVPEGMERLSWQRMKLPDQMIATGAFERVERAEISFATQPTDVKSISEPQIFAFGDYQAKVTQLSVSFSRCDYEIEVTKTTGEGKTAGQEWVDGEGEWTFAVLAEGCETSPSVSSTRPKNLNEEMPSAELLCRGTVILTGETDSVTFVPCSIERGMRLDEYPDGAVYEAQAPVTPEQKEMMFTIHLR